MSLCHQLRSPSSGIASRLSLSGLSKNCNCHCPSSTSGRYSRIFAWNFNQFVVHLLLGIWHARWRGLLLSSELCARAQEGRVPSRLGNSLSSIYLRVFLAGWETNVVGVSVCDKAFLTIKLNLSIIVASLDALLLLQKNWQRPKRNTRAVTCPSPTRPQTASSGT